MKRTKRLVISAIKCLLCGDVLVSKNRHDFNVCSCPEKGDTWVAIDGGRDYTKVATNDNSKWVWLTLKEVPIRGKK